MATEAKQSAYQVAQRMPEESKASSRLFQNQAATPTLEPEDASRLARQVQDAAGAASVITKIDVVHRELERLTEVIITVTYRALTKKSPPNTDRFHCEISDKDLYGGGLWSGNFARKLINTVLESQLPIISSRVMMQRLIEELEQI